MPRCRRSPTLAVLGGLLACLTAASEPAPAGPPDENSSAAPEVTAFVDVQVVPMDREEILSSHTVVVKGDRIVAMGPSGDVLVPADARRIVGAGRYLMPGLVDMHTHPRTPEELRLFVANGVTSVMVFGSSDEIRSWLPGAESEPVRPTLHTCPTHANLQNADRARRFVLDQHHLGFDCVKVYARGVGAWSEEAYRAFVGAARDREMLVMGHLPRNLDLEIAVINGQHSVAHAEEFLYAHFFKYSKDPLDEGRIAGVARLTAMGGVYVTGTLVAFDYIGRMTGMEFLDLLTDPSLAYVPPEVRDRWGPGRNRYRARFDARDSVMLRRSMDFQKKMMLAMHRAGVPLLVGTDASHDMPFVVAGFSAHEELAHLVKLGLRPYEALRAATVRGAELLRQAEEFGSVAVGRRADLLLVGGNPLDDLRHVSRPEGVMLRGRWLPASELRAVLADIAASYEAPPDVQDPGTSHLPPGRSPLPSSRLP
jgi:Amidohydrolase family